MTVLVLIASCASEGGTAAEADAGTAAAPDPKPAPAAPSFSGPVLDGSGACTGPVPTAATAIEPGIGECGSGCEVQVLYNEPGAKELYFFVNNRLDRIVKS